MTRPAGRSAGSTVTTDSGRFYAFQAHGPDIDWPSYPTSGTTDEKQHAAHAVREMFERCRPRRLAVRITADELLCLTSVARPAREQSFQLRLRHG